MFLTIFTKSFILNLVSASFHYFWKSSVLLAYLQWNTLKRNVTYGCFIFPLFHKHLFSPELPRSACLLKTSCFEKITMCNQNNAREVAACRWIKHEEKWTNRSSTNQDKIVTVLKTYLNDSKNVFPLFK